MSSSLLPGSLWAACCLALVSGVPAQDAPPVQAHIDTTAAWMGQKVVIVVELFSPTRFQGSPGFQIPPVPGALVMQSAESPVLSSRSIDDHEYFVQRHEVLVFPQREGAVRIPPIPVRFGITGDPPADREGATPEFTFISNRPPGTEMLGTVVTTPSLSVTETWDAKPTDSGDGAEDGTGATAMTGDAFLRTVVIKAADLPGMVLPTLPTDAPDGLRVYPREPLVADKNERGTLTGTRTETLSYLCAAPGRYTLPELRFPWWDPVNKQVRTETLPAVSFTVIPNPNAATGGADEAGALGGQSGRWLRGLVLGALLAFLATATWRARHRITKRWHAWRTSEPVKFRHLRKTCRGADPAAILRAYHDWLRTRDPAHRAPWNTLASSPGPLHQELRHLQAALFSNTQRGEWNGTKLAAALVAARRTLVPSPSTSTRTNLAPLNPA